jgi:hypothetical protein
MGKWAKYGRKYRRQWEEEAWAKGILFYYFHFQLDTNVLII